MKHGPIALIDERMPVVAIVPRDHVYEKMVSQVEQVKARGGIVIAVATEGDSAIAAQGRPRPLRARRGAPAAAAAHGHSHAAAWPIISPFAAAAMWTSRAISPRA